MVPVSTETEALPSPAVAPAVAPTHPSSHEFQWPPAEADLDRVSVLAIDPPPEPAARAFRPAPSPGPLHADVTAEPAPAGNASVAIEPRPLVSKPAVRTSGPGTSPVAGPLAIIREQVRRYTPQRRRAGSAGLVGTMLAVAATGILSFAAAWWWRGLDAAANQPATLLVETTPPGARVLVDGEHRGDAPLKIAVAPGARQLTIEAGGQRREQRVEFVAGSQVSYHFDVGPVAGIVPAAALADSAVGTAGEWPPVPVDATTGAIQVATDPSGATVMIDGQTRGRSPTAVTGLAPGYHNLQLTGPAGTVRRRVLVEAGRVARLSVPMTSIPTTGGVAVLAPFELQVLENGTEVGRSGALIQLPPGPHDLEFVNDVLEVRIARRVVVTAGATGQVNVTPPDGRVNVNAQPWAEVFIEGRRLGETPLGQVTLPVGLHELVFRHPQLGERREMVVVRANTTSRVAVAFKP